METNKLVQDFAQSLRGELIQPSDNSYDEARKLYNAMIDRRPRFIVRCADVVVRSSTVVAPEPECS